jgi:tetratricopeptide (TPR) repeat protein
LPPCRLAASPPSVLDGIATLVDRSLVREVEEADGELRFAMLETLREYGLERLDAAGETEAVRAAHATWALALAETARAEIDGPAQGAWLDRLETEHDNLRAALGWADSAAASQFGRLASALLGFWELRGHLTEGRRWLEAALDRIDDADPGLRIDVLNAGSALAFAQGDFTAAAERIRQGLTLARQSGDRRREATLLTGLGSATLAQGNLEAADAAYAQSRDVFRELGDRWRYANALAGLGAVAHTRGDADRARHAYEEGLGIWRELGDRASVAFVLGNLIALLASIPEERACARAYGEEALALARALGDRQGEAFVVGNLGLLAELEGDLAAARTLYGQSLDASRDLDDQGGIARALGSLAAIAVQQGDDATAIELCRSSLGTYVELGEQQGIAWSLETFAAIAHGRDDPARAARLLGAAAAIRERTGVAIPPEDRERHARVVVAVRDRLGDGAYADAVADGRSLDIADAIDEAFSLS